MIKQRNGIARDSTVIQMNVLTSQIDDGTLCGEFTSPAFLILVFNLTVIVTLVSDFESALTTHNGGCRNPMKHIFQTK